MQVVYVARNPKDMVVSYFNHLKTLQLQGFESGFGTLFEHFINGQGMQIVPIQCVGEMIIFHLLTAAPLGLLDFHALLGGGV